MTLCVHDMCINDVAYLRVHILSRAEMIHYDSALSNTWINKSFDVSILDIISCGPVGK